MSTQPNPVGPQRVYSAVANTCPHWCAFHQVGHEVQELGEVVHVSGPLIVNRTVLLLASSINTDTGAPDGPIVYVGEQEYTMYQAEVLIDALTHLVDEGTGRTELTGLTESPARPITKG